MSSKPLILLEFNELCPSLMDRFIEQGHLPNFARLKRESSIYTTDAGEDTPNLNPWIQWVTVHSGKSFAEHRVFHLGETAKRSIPMLWDAVSRAGKTSWVCGSMNAAVAPGFKGWFLPDPWEAGARAFPENFESYMRLVRSYVFDYTSDRRPATLGVVARFLKFMLLNGLRIRTMIRIGMHLVRERFAEVKWRRASILDWLQFDLFRWVYRRERPYFATLFYNSTAHYQHAYWRNMQPELFAVKPSDMEQRSRANAVLFGYQEMDRIVGEIFDLAGPDTAIVLATALSQQPFLSYESSGGKTFYKPIDFIALLDFIGIDRHSCVVEPVMSEQFHLRFRDELAAAAAKQLLDETFLESGVPVFYSKLNENAVFTGCSIYDPVGQNASARSRGGSRLFNELFYQVESLKSGMHHRDGIFWTRIPNEVIKFHSGKLPLTATARMILDIMGVDASPLALKDRKRSVNPIVSVSRVI